VLHGERVVLRPVVPADVVPFHALLQEPDVACWWGIYDAEKVEREVIGREDGVDVFAVLLDGEVVGMIQAWEEDDPEYRHAGIDVSLATRCHGQGLGTDAVRTLARHLIEDRGHHRVTIDPAADNARAIRCYEKVGFQRVGILREYWHAPDGTWRDGLLLDLLAEDLEQAAQ
jgi:aminoglycoside 6'-N-acetyltransferase